MRVLITAGPVYGRLDDNKLVSNRSRGIWAAKFAGWLTGEGVQVTLLIPDTHVKSIAPIAENEAERPESLSVIQHSGFDDYRGQCYQLAQTHDAAVMASAVVNWIPAKPIPGKMSTKGFNEGDTIQIPFVLAERVINRMRRINPKLTLIGCKMLAGSTHGDLIDAAHAVVMASKANVVLANDLGNLHTKHLVYPDRCVQTFEDDWVGLYQELWRVLTDEHWHTEHFKASNDGFQVQDPEACALFDRVVDKYRSRFTTDHAFGSLLVPSSDGKGFFSSPRSKGPGFTSQDAVYVSSFLDATTATVLTGAGGKATKNAPLMIRVAHRYRAKQGPGSPFPVVLHLHEQLPGVPAVPYAPPGTSRDNLRAFPGPVFNIEGHGFIACLGPDLEPVAW